MAVLDPGVLQGLNRLGVRCEALIASPALRFHFVALELMGMRR